MLSRPGPRMMRSSVLPLPSRMVVLSRWCAVDTPLTVADTSVPFDKPSPVAAILYVQGRFPPNSEKLLLAPPQAAVKP